jgi:hypothetical protein
LRRAAPGEPTHVTCHDYCPSEAHALAASEAKAILIARAASIDVPGGWSGPQYFPPPENTFDVFGQERKWYVYCHRSGGGATAVISEAWDLIRMIAGPPPFVIWGKQ